MGNRYSPSEFVKTAYSLVVTKVFFPQARLIRRPVYMRGGKSLEGGKGLTTGRFCRFDLDGTKQTLLIGDNCEMGDMTHIVALNHVEIGKDVLIASKCFISDTSHGCYNGDNPDSPDSIPNRRALVSGTTRIGDRVWIGENAVILAGADIGDGCIIGAGSIVSKPIPAGSMVVGTNRILKRWNPETGTWERVKGNEA